MTGSREGGFLGVAGALPGGRVEIGVDGWEGGAWWVGGVSAAPAAAE